METDLLKELRNMTKELKEINKSLIKEQFVVSPDERLEDTARRLMNEGRIIVKKD